MINRILVALDTSERRAAVFDTAAGLALKFEASLYLVRAISVAPEFPAAAATSVADPLPAHLRGVALSELTELWKRAPQLSQTEPIVSIGRAHEIILETARDLDVDMIVVGSHGYQGWDRLLGTTAAKVANQADRNVLVVHQRTTEDTARINPAPFRIA